MSQRGLICITCAKTKPADEFLHGGLFIKYSALCYFLPSGPLTLTDALWRQTYSWKNQRNNGSLNALHKLHVVREDIDMINSVFWALSVIHCIMYRALNNHTTSRWSVIATGMLPVTLNHRNQNNSNPTIWITQTHVYVKTLHTK